MIIRHTNSFLFSILFHTFLAVLIFFSWKNISSKQNKSESKKVLVKLCCVAEKKPTPKIAPIPKPEVKQKPKPKPKPKPIIKKRKIKPIKKIKPQPKPKKVQIQKEITKTQPAIVVDSPIEIKQDKDAKQKQITKDYLEKNIIKIRQLISDNLYYPRSARKRGKVGEVIVKFKLLKDGTVKYIEVVSSKSDILSRAAKKTIQNLSGEFPKPKEDLVIKVPIAYKLK